MQIIYFIMATSLIFGAFAADKSPMNEIDVVRGCEGEYCFCPNNGVIPSSLLVYEKMDKKSPVILNLKKGDSVETTDVHMKFVKPGRWLVQKSESEFKKGEILTHLRYRGEGDFNANKGTKSVNGNDEDGSLLKQIEPSEIETWYTIKVKDKVGFSLVNPFSKCDKANFP